jgi:hypothetical protein
LTKARGFLYDDLREHRLTGRHKLSPADRQNVARWILFLENDLAYEWPVVPLAIRLALLPINLVTLGFAGRIVQRYASRGGDTEVWPFRRRRDYQAVLRRPPYRGGAA